ncbi:MAG: PD40 domain-containing protein [Chloroflexi bacterium]|nr:PD40 domain-containing protein [Chloroflexota bacterium]
MRFLVRRLALTLFFTVLMMCVSSASVLIGRQSRAPIVAVLLFDIRPEQLVYDLIDIDHGLASRRALTIPGSSYSRIRFDVQPPLVLQALPVGESLDWTLNQLDLMHAALTPILRMSALASPPVAIGTVQQSGGSVSIYAPRDRLVYRSSLADPQATVVATAPQDVQSVVWSPDWSRLVLSAIRSVTLVYMDGAQPVTLPPLGDVRMSPAWSPDGRYIVFSPQTSILNYPIPVLNADTAAVIVTKAGRAPYWCADRLVYTTDRGGGMLEVRLTDAALDADQVILTRDLSAARPSERTLAARPLDKASCDWFMVSTFGGDTWLLHRESGMLHELGTGLVGLLDVAPDSFIYWSEAGRNTEIRRFTLDPSAPRSDLLLTLDGRGATITRLEEGRGWIVLQATSELLHVDQDSGEGTLLTDTMVRAYSVLP